MKTEANHSLNKIRWGIITRKKYVKKENYYKTTCKQKKREIKENKFSTKNDFFINPGTINFYL